MPTNRNIALVIFNLKSLLVANSGNQYPTAWAIQKYPIKNRRINITALLFRYGFFSLNSIARDNGSKNEREPGSLNIFWAECVGARSAVPVSSA